MSSKPHDTDRPSTGSTVALVCSWLCVIAYLLPILHVVGRTYEGIKSFGLSLLILIPSLPIGTICGGVSFCRSDSGSATGRRAGWALVLIWLTPIIVFLSLVIFVFILSSKRTNA